MVAYLASPLASATNGTALHVEGSRRILAFNGASVSFHIKDYRRDEAGRPRVMTLSAAEFIRRFLLHVLPRGFHRIRHYGFLTRSNRKFGLAHIHKILGAPASPRPTAVEPITEDGSTDARSPSPVAAAHDDRRLLRGLASAPWAAPPLHFEPGSSP
ncbi:hypothetical protein AEGHOMDF_2666 [Methylobacterium soli]|nr:hypothetical protein AEGHOMDF_2666 [Methylobacterium soli]